MKRIVFVSTALALSFTACSSQRELPPVTPSPATDSILADATPLGRLGVVDRGPAPAQTQLDVAVTLRYKDQPALDRLVAEQSDPTSTHYRHWLTNAQFTASFAASASDYTRVANSMRAAGMRIVRTYDNRSVIDASGTIDLLERYFRTSIHRVSNSSGSIDYANTVTARAPNDIAHLVLSVEGLNTVVVARTHHALLAPHGPAQRNASPGGKLMGPISTVTGYRGYAPLAFSVAYDFPARHQGSSGKTLNGSGRASGIVIDADFAESDLTAYLAYFHIKRTGPSSKRILLDGGPPKGDAGADSVEAALDAETLVSLAPGTALSVYEIPKFTNVLITDAFNRVASDNVVDTVNSSFGGCEYDIGTHTVQAWNHIAEQAAAKGITFHASTGDTGGSMCANAPASLPYVVAIGGTALTVGTGGTWASEVGWSGSGGSISSIFPLPSWQRAMPGTIDRGRNIPDFALDADPETGIAFYFTGTWNSQFNPLGGTSLASPIFGAAVTQIDELQNGRLGNAAARLYAVWNSKGYGAGSAATYHDIVYGSNGTYDAAPGYDLVSGVGSIDFWNTAQNL